MPLTNNPTQQGGGLPQYIISEAKIIAARSISFEEIGGVPIDLGIELELEVQKKDGTMLDFNPKLRIFGNFNKNAEYNTPQFWSAATRVKIAFQNLGIKWDTFDETKPVPDSILEQCIGKSIWRLQFTGRVKKDHTLGYKDYQRVYLTTRKDGKERLEKDFKSDVQNGYVKVLSEDDLIFPPPEAVDTPTSQNSQL